MHFITCIWTIRVTVTAETGKNALARRTAEVVITWTWAIKFITEVTTVIHLVARKVTRNTAIVVALEVGRATCAQSCEYFAHFTYEFFYDSYDSQSSLLDFDTVQSGRSKLFGEHTISNFMVQDGGISFFCCTRVHSVLTQQATIWILPHVDNLPWLPYTLNTLCSD